MRKVTELALLVGSVTMAFYLQLQVNSPGIEVSWPPHAGQVSRRVTNYGYDIDKYRRLNVNMSSSDVKLCGYSKVNIIHKVSCEKCFPSATACTPTLKITSTNTTKTPLLLKLDK